MAIAHGGDGEDTGQCPLMHITHDESTFYANDQRKTKWIHCTEKAKPRTKGEGNSIMISDFCLPEIGWLQSLDSSRKARVTFRAGKNRDSYFTHEDLLEQVKSAIDIFDERFPNAQAVFTFDNATSHQKCSADALSARNMPKFPGWAGKKAVSNMRPGPPPKQELSVLLLSIRFHQITNIPGNSRECGAFSSNVASKRKPS